MAFRAAAISSPGTATYTPTPPTGWQAGDYLALVFVLDTTSSEPTMAAGDRWTLRASVTHATPDTHRIVYYDRIATGDEAGDPAEWAWSGFGSIGNFAIMAAFTGRDATTPINFITTTDYQVADASPVTADLDSGTADDGDDIAVFLGLDLQNAGTGEWTCAPPTGDAVNGAYTERADTHPQNWVAGCLATFDDSGAGALGTISVVATRSSAGTSAYSGIVVAIAAEGAADPGEFMPTAAGDFFRTRLR